MNSIRIREFERSARRVREVLTMLTDDELKTVTEILQNAGFASALEQYSRERDRQEAKEPALV